MNKLALHAIAALFLLPFFLTGCFDTPKDLVAPSWDVAVNMPITDTAYSLIEIVKPENNPNLAIIDDEIYDSIYFLFSDQIEKIVSIQDTIKMPVKVAPEEMVIASPGGGSSNMIYNPDASYRLDTALFKSGYLKMKLQNKNSNANVEFELKAPGFKKKTDKSPLVFKGTLAPGQTYDHLIEIKDYSYAQLRRAGSNTDSTQRADGFLIMGSAKSANNNVDFVTQVTNDQITLSRLVGKLKRTELSYATSSFDQTFGKEAKDVRSKIRFKATTVELRSRTFGAMKNLNIIMDSMTVTGYNYQSNGTLGNPIKLLFNGKPYFSDTLSAGEEFKLIFNENNSSVAEFLSTMPDVIKMGSKNILDNISATSKATISNEDYIKFDMKISAPAYFAIADAGYQDTVDIELSQNELDNISRGNSATIFVDMINKIPLGIKAKATFMDQNYKPLFTIRNISNTTSNEIIDVAPCAVDNNGRPTTPSTSKVGVTLDKNDFQKFKNAKFIVFDVYVRSTGSTDVLGTTFVQVRSKDSVRFRVYGGVNYNLDPEDM